MCSSDLGPGKNGAEPDGMERGGAVEIEIDDAHPYWISGNNVDGFVITQERSRYGYQA